jgi:hypothetical protein
MEMGGSATGRLEGCGRFVQSRYALGVCAACTTEFVGS